jgi:thioredoxin-related protein
MGRTLIRLLALYPLVFGFPALAQAPDEQDLPPVTIVNTTDLHADAERAQQRQVPILLMFAQEGCAYCQVVEEEFLKPMLRNDAYRNKVLIRRVMLDDFDDIRGFDGGETTADQLALRYGARMTPTVVFLAPNGRELAPRIVGLQTVDFYGGDLDNAIDASLTKLRSVAFQQDN